MVNFLFFISVVLRYSIYLVLWIRSTDPVRVKNSKKLPLEICCSIPLFIKLFEFAEASWAAWAFAASSAARAAIAALRRARAELDVPACFRFLRIKLYMRNIFLSNKIRHNFKWIRFYPLQVM